MKAAQNLLYSIILKKKPVSSLVSTPKCPIFACPVRHKGPPFCTQERRIGPNVFLTKGFQPSAERIIIQFTYQLKN